MSQNVRLLHTNVLYEITTSNSSLRNQFVETLRSRTPKIVFTRFLYQYQKFRKGLLWTDISPLPPNERLVLNTTNSPQLLCMGIY
jgi:hypothetical protein